MQTSNLQLSPEQRAAILAHPGEPVHIADEATRKVYLLIEQGAFPELEEEYIRSKLDEGFAASDRGEEEDWDSESIKAEGRRRLDQRKNAQ
jgi:hypothetical protein